MSFSDELPRITCKYTCHECGLHRVEVSVPIRTTQDVTEWIDRVCAYFISGDHAARSPHCTARKMDELMIPIEGADKIGGPRLT